jgi:hypothetical protein
MSHNDILVKNKIFFVLIFADFTLKFLVLIKINGDFYFQKFSHKIVYHFLEKILP